MSDTFSSYVRPTHILIIDPYTDIGGPHQVMRRIVHQLSSERYHFHAITPTRGATYQDLQRAGADVIALPDVVRLTRTTNLIQRSFALAGWLGAVARIIPLIHGLHIDVVHSTTPACWAGGLAARLTRTPSVYHVHDLTLGSQRLIGLAVGTIMGLTADRIICVSQSAQRALPVPKLTSKKAVVVHNAVDLAEFRSSMEGGIHVRDDLGISRDAPVVASFGGLDKRKGQEYLIRAAAHVIRVVPDTQFLIVGDESLGAAKDGYGAMIKTLARDLGLESNLTFLGARTDVPSLMQCVDILAHPSLTEGGPLVPQEAMASEIPVVATDVGANPEAVEDGVTGVLVPAANPERMAQAIISLLQDEPRRKQMGAAGRRRVETHYNLTKEAAKMAAIYESLIH